MKLTPWFPPTTKPVYVGVYDVADGDMFKSPWFRFWDGEKWKQGDETPYNASMCRLDAIRIGRWRGLASKP